MSSNFMKGALIITAASLLSKLLGSLFRIPLQNIAGDDVFGIFSIVYPVYMAVLILSVAGIPLAISKLIAEARAAGDDTGIRHIFVTASILAASIGTGMFLLLAAVSVPLSVQLGGAFTLPALLVVSATLLVAPYMAVYRGFFQGYDDMRPTALSQVLEQFVRVFFILLFAFILTVQGYGAPAVAGGVMTGSILGALASLVYLRRFYQKSPVRPKKAERYTGKDFRKWSKTILAVALPICVGALALAIVNFIDSMSVPQQLRAIGVPDLEVAAQYGYYGRGIALVQIAVVFAQALILPLIPLITAAMAEGKAERTALITEQALKFMHVTSWPAAVGLFVLTVPLNYALFGDTMASDVLAVVHLSAAATAFAILTTGILQGMNRQLYSAGIVAAVSVVKVGLNIVLIQYFGLIGVAWSTLAAYVLLTVWNVWLMKKTAAFKLWGNREGRIMLAAVLMGALVYAPSFWIDAASLSRPMALLYVLVLMGAGGVVYGVLLLVFRAMKEEELRRIPVIGGRLARLTRTS
ncbi:putative polysaccharide biosynthesis protein [Alkalicoccus urumqiensis]|uniref:Polysaccharide biosynthesis/transport protein n=1 Tax=Alkalicoccus urumqiensis TaxID=1548213 RepID=A0A2P6MHB3_ALKUR|nr:polysaccharide biosynthesis protein [Alkalicoccus urumqiensis]PRO65685.1 polysaccharide biosynthesis/transport protein [Alkalicoccus urumqiensis]